MSSKIYYWKLTTAQPFLGKPSLIDSLRILRVDNLTLSDATIIYIEGWTLADPKTGVTIDIINPSGQIRTWRWNDMTYNTESAVQPNQKISRQQDLMTLFYSKLGASRLEYAGTLVLADIP